jgi:2-desacetyl-2-hydroxyethyl bacteriochlorophyllide A dehydrogenase
VRGVVYLGPGEVAVRELPRPQLIGPRDAIVRVTRAGVCGTDLHPYRGELPDFAVGTVLGHEFAGVVEEAGDEVPFRPGRRVFASDVVACGRCTDCRRDRHYHCADVGLFGYSTVVGTAIDGGQAEYVRVPYADVVLAATPDDVSDEQALFVGDVLTTAYAAARRAELRPGGLVVVVGGGPVGLLAAQCAAVLGAGRAVVVDPDPRRRAFAESLGVSATTRDGLAGTADAVIEAVGSDEALRCALELAGPQATVSSVGAHHATAMPFPSGTAFARELTVRFTVGNPIALRDEVLALVRAKRLDPAHAISHRLPLADAARSYELFDTREAFKVVLTMPN